MAHIVASLRLLFACWLGLAEQGAHGPTRSENGNTP